MAVDSPPPPDVDPEDEGGGPVKPFLDHLEDLRWTVIKVLAAVIVSMFVCLVAGRQLVQLLTWPLIQSQQLIASTNVTAVIRAGDMVIGRVPIGGHATNLAAPALPPSFQVVIVPDGTNFTLQLEPEPFSITPRTDPDVPMLKNYSPIGGIIVALKLALYGGMSLAAPFVMLFIGQFVLPAMRRHEKQFIYRAVAIGVGLFIVGVVFCYFIIMQITLLATVQFSNWLGFQADEWRAEDYIDFVLKMMLAVGLSFQLPVILLTLVKVGVLDYEKLTRYRSYFIVGNMVACALITPSGDPFTMLLLAIPVQGLYEISVFIAKVWWRREQREYEEAEGAANTT
ncbi:MAG: twin-arginine translocase subunit TatC [Verrucomicrobiae bacterium]|nr:twin-arginine translocase subunit TatC [Verrucomicrobiae bacterium]